MPFARACVLCIKLALLLKTMNSTSSLSSHVFCSLTVDDVKALQLVRQCRLLESTNLTSKILFWHSIRCSDQGRKWLQLVPQLPFDIKVLNSPLSISCTLHCHLTAVSWPKIWDHAMENSAPVTSCTQALLQRLLSLYPNYDNESTSAHFLAEHTSHKTSPSNIV